MFTGIVQDKVMIIKIAKREQFQTHTLEFPNSLLEGLAIGASVAHNGCCLTVTAIQQNQVTFDLMQETLRVTNLGLLQNGDSVNIERAAKFGDEIGGHSMSGHINAIASISERIETPNNCTLWFELPESLSKYVLTKGYIGIDGCSLTIGEVRDNQFCVHLIPETLQRTLFGERKVGDKVNIEVDPTTQAIVDTVERVLASKQV
ncbi:riboflavin synthase subunit alpha [Vibrio sp. SS-MA-C1-2]|uniref:riboflavin synthase subunit alpha n=1 Tax=Vibrio sp. SS-MA-C1-2 TaxID=2908646 RepID=UPI001F4353AA|nr:riboflavin synthase subunit alpha [Vibrio sp. SS-MA-C1-2]UJF18315.1 riboflavin synthase subunit alpha [Vibrio sp. SS-MA-C1-2]